MIRKTLMFAAASLMTVSAATAASASSGPAPTGKASCPPKYVCVWDNNTFSGKPALKSQGNITRTLKSGDGISIFNNGRAYPGKDHIYYKYYYPSGGGMQRGCLHYPGDSPSTHRSATARVVFESVRWGGEC